MQLMGKICEPVKKLGVKSELPYLCCPRGSLRSGVLKPRAGGEGPRESPFELASTSLFCRASFCI